MSYFKKSVSAVTAAVMVLTVCLSLFSVRVSAKTIIDNGDFKYKVLEDGKTVEILKYSGSSLYVTLPSVIDEYKVVSVGTSAFRHNTAIKELEFSDSIKIIGISAFEGCTSLKRAELSENLKTIKSSAFSGCTALSELVIKESLSEIEDYAFAGCTSLSDVYLPEMISSIGEYSFYNCTSLSNIEIPKGVKYIGGDFLENTRWLNSQNSEFVIVGDGILIKYKGKDSSKTVSDKVKTIGCRAFAGNNDITEIIIPKSVTGIESSAFENCLSLQSVYMPETISKIGEKAFYNCTVLDSVQLPEGLQKIEKECFAKCQSLRKIVIPKSTTVIGESAFEGCTSMTEAEISEGLKSIKEFAFKDCTSVGMMSFPQTLKEIFEHAFDGCISLTRVEFNGNTKIMGSAFYQCTNLKEAVFRQQPAEVDENAFNMVPELVLYGDDTKGSYLYNYAKGNGKQLEGIHQLAEYRNRGVLDPPKEEEEGISSGYIVIIIFTVIIEIGLVAIFSVYILFLMPKGRHMRQSQAKYAAKPNQRQGVPKTTQKPARHIQSSSPPPKRQNPNK